MSYKEQDDDDDFISAVDIAKRSRVIKSTESKSSTRQPPQKRDEKLSKSKEKQELDLESKITPIELPVPMEDKEQSGSCQLIVSHHESKISSEIVTDDDDDDDQDENSLPKSKRMKHEEEDVTDKDESYSEEEKEPTPRKKPIYKTAESEMPIIPSIDHNLPPPVTHIQQNSSNAISDHSNRTSSIPLGFPTSKIIIPSLHTSRVGLSRKSSTIKSLHPNINSRLIHE